MGGPKALISQGAASKVGLSHALLSLSPSKEVARQNPAVDFAGFVFYICSCWACSGGDKLLSAEQKEQGCSFLAEA